jgi:hypothetical protein
MAQSTAVVQCFTTSPQLLANVQSLMLWFLEVDVVVLHNFFSLIPQLRNLDARRSDAGITAALCIPVISHSGSPTVVCPVLQSLAVTSLDPVAVRNVLQSRQSASVAMDHVMFRQGFPAGDYYEEDLKWLMERVGVGARAPYLEPSWMSFSSTSL